jgi:predicted transcriptional regulator
LINRISALAESIHSSFFIGFKENIYTIKILHKLGGIIIKQSSIKALDEKDFEFIEALHNLDMPKGVATLITILASVNEATSREIEMGAGLRQPEVSIAMRMLRENNWVNEREVKAKGKGRPMKIYKLGIPLDKIIEYYESKKKTESVQAMQAIQRLKEMIVA